MTLEVTDKPWPWPKALLAGAILAAVTGTILTGVNPALSLRTLPSFTENALLAAFVIRSVTESKDMSPRRMFRVFLIGVGILAANRLLFHLLEKATGLQFR